MTRFMRCTVCRVRVLTPPGVWIPDGIETVCERCKKMERKVREHPPLALKETDYRQLSRRPNLEDGVRLSLHTSEMPTPAAIPDPWALGYHCFMAVTFLVAAGVLLVGVLR